MIDSKRVPFKTIEKLLKLMDDNKCFHLVLGNLTLDRAITAPPQEKEKVVFEDEKRLSPEDNEALIHSELRSGRY